MIPKYFYQRKSERNFQKRKVSEKKLLKILEAAMRAPTCGNMQLYSVVITHDKEKKKLLEEQHFNQPAAVTADVILTICADFQRFVKWCKAKGAKPGYDNFHSFITALTDAVIYSQQIVTIAEMEGLSTCYLGTVNYNAKEISELLNLPKLVIPVASLAIGISKKEKPDTDRLPIEAIIHSETYKEESDSDILQSFKTKENFKANQEIVANSGMLTLAHVFTDIRYPREMNEKVSQTFMQLLKEKDFIKD